MTEKNFPEADEASDKIILFDANWSGPARMAISAVLHTLNILDVSGYPVFYINIDDLAPEKTKQLLGKQSHGNGEAAVVTSGQIKARHTKGDLTPFLNYLKETFRKQQL